MYLAIGIRPLFFFFFFQVLNSFKSCYFRRIVQLFSHMLLTLVNKNLICRCSNLSICLVMGTFFPLIKKKKERTHFSDFKILFIFAIFFVLWLNSNIGLLLLVTNALSQASREVTTLFAFIFICLLIGRICFFSFQLTPHLLSPLHCILFFFNIYYLQPVLITIFFQSSSEGFRSSFVMFVGCWDPCLLR